MMVARGYARTRGGGGDSTRADAAGAGRGVGGSDRLTALAERLDDRDQPATPAALPRRSSRSPRRCTRSSRYIAYELVVGRGDGGGELARSTVPAGAIATAPEQLGRERARARESS